MAAGKVWIAPEVVQAFQELLSKLGGYPPILNVIGTERPRGTAALHQPTLYPELNVPADATGDWGEVARGIAHLRSSIDGVPALRGGPTDQAIALDLNSELQIIAAMQEGVKPKPKWDQSNLEPLVESILNPTQDALPSFQIFQLLRLQRVARDGHPEAQHALTRVGEKIPELLAEAAKLFDEITSHDLRTAAGKARAATTLLTSLQFDLNQFFLQQSQFLAGVHENRSLGYYPVLQKVQAQFEAARPTPATWLKFQLPFALPLKEGVYHAEKITILVKHTRVVDVRAGWRPSQDSTVDTVMNPSGLYARSTVEIWLPGEFKIDDAVPPSEIFYRNVASYPEAVRIATLRLNTLIAGLRVEIGRSDIPEIFPGQLTQLAYRLSMSTALLFATFQVLIWNS
jgi:hypothetical protein